MKSLLPLIAALSAITWTEPGEMDAALDATVPADTKLEKPKLGFVW